MSLTNTQHTSTDPAATRALGHDGRAGRRRVSNGSPTQVLRSVTAALLAAAREVDEASTARDPPGSRPIPPPLRSQQVV